MKRVKFLTKGLRAVHGQPREPQFYHLVDEVKDLDDDTARVAVEAKVAVYVDAPELEADEAGDSAEVATPEGEKKGTVLSSWFGGGSDAPAPAPKAEPEAEPEAAADDAGGIPPALE